MVCIGFPTDFGKVVIGYGKKCSLFLSEVLKNVKIFGKERKALDPWCILLYNTIIREQCRNLPVCVEICTEDLCVRRMEHYGTKCSIS